MTKLNYVNRKSTGLKLGQIVQKDLKKRLTASSSKYDSSSPLDLGLGGKDLTDDGVDAFALTLAETLTSSGASVNTRLQVLHLQRNGLTARSLAQLAPVIKAAYADLEDLDLADNLIIIATPDDFVAWETFLSAFEDCHNLKRVNLAGNDLSDPVAFEILSRVYMSQISRNMSSFSTRADYSTFGDNDAHGLDKVDVKALSVRDINLQDEGPVPAGNRTPSEQTENKVRGLPCIQVVDISRVSMTEAGALFLSWIIQRHRWVQGAMYRRSWGTHGPGSASIITTNASKITKPTAKLLAHAETSAYHPFESLENVDLSTGIMRQEDAQLNESRRASATSNHSRRVSDFLASPMSLVSSPGTANIASQELENLRRRLQRSTIEELGLSKVQLWATAIRLLCFVRRVLVEDRPIASDRRDSEATYALAAAQRPHTLDPVDARRRTSSVSSAGRDGMRQSSTSFESPILSYAAKLTGVKGSTNAPSPSPRTPQVLRAPRVRARKDSHTTSTTERHDSAIEIEDREEPARLLMRMTTLQPQMSGPLPVEVWSEVLFLHADPDHILSDRQRRAVIAYGQSRAALRQETESLGKAKNVQIWLVLERMGCLMYDDSE